MKSLTRVLLGVALSLGVVAFAPAAATRAEAHGGCGHHHYYSCWHTHYRCHSHCYSSCYSHCWHSHRHHHCCHW